jgi:hypothetical protein
VHQVCCFDHPSPLLQEENWVYGECLQQHAEGGKAFLRQSRYPQGLRAPASFDDCQGKQASIECRLQGYLQVRI